ncbi:class I SAM-dependent methyltransferase [Nonomuraea basaltis]|nr:class I SAM-dependent methyltransferase [Nonomuraea basaltis]
MRDSLYGDAARITQRTTALRHAKTAGRHPADVIAGLASPGRRGTVVDIGCGRGTTTLTLAQRLAPPRLIGFDQSAALLAVAARRLAGHAHVEFLQGDFHAIALADASASATAIVAAFTTRPAPPPRSLRSPAALPPEGYRSRSGTARSRPPPPSPTSWPPAHEGLHQDLRQPRCPPEVTRTPPVDRARHTRHPYTGHPRRTLHRDRLRVPTGATRLTRRPANPG